VKREDTGFGEAGKEGERKGEDSFMKKTIIATVTAMALAMMFVAGSQLVMAKPDDARLTAAKGMMKAMGSDRMLDAAMTNMSQIFIRMLTARNPGKEKKIAEIMQRVMAKMSHRNREPLDEVAAIYAKYFTIAEMKEITAFYQTPTGKKLVAKIPVIMQDSMLVSQKWGQRIGQEMMRRLREEAAREGLRL